MKIIPLIAAAIAVAAVSAPASAQSMDAATCSALFRQLDKNKDGTLSPREARAYIDRVNNSDMRLMDQRLLQRSEFNKACARQMFVNM
jgi:hypothetical protein